MGKKLIFFIVFFLLIINYSVSAQFFTKHYIAPAPWQYFSKANEIVIATNSSSKVNITLTKSDGSFITSLTAIKGGPAVYRFSGLPSVFGRNLLNTVISGAGIFVTSTGTVSVNLRNIASDDLGSDGNEYNIKGNASMTSFGNAGIGVEFRVGYYRDGFTIGNETPIYSVMAIEDNTIIRLNGMVLSTLNKGQSYLFTASLGALMETSKPSVMNAGAFLDQVDYCTDGTSNQIAPVSVLGTEYFIERGKGSDNAEQTTVVATQSNTLLKINFYSITGALVRTVNKTLVNAGDFYTFINGVSNIAFTASNIVATKKVAVYSGTADRCEVDLITVAPVSTCSGSNFVETSDFKGYNNNSLDYFGYVLLRDAKAIVNINGYNLESVSGTRHQLGTTGWYLIDFTRTQIGGPSIISLSSTSLLTVSMVQQGQGFSMAAFFSNFVAQPSTPKEIYVEGPNCMKDSAIITADAGFDPYQWYYNGVIIPGETNNMITVLKTGTYSVLSTLNCGISSQSVPLNIMLCSDVSVTQTVDIDVPCIGSDVVFTIKASNLGPSNAENVFVTDQLPSGYTYISSVASPGTSYNSLSGIWTISDLDSKANAILTIKASVRDSGMFSNLATITSSYQPDINVDNNIFSISTSPVVSPTAAKAGLDQTILSVCGLGKINLHGNIPIFGNGKWIIIKGNGGTFVSDTDPETSFSGIEGENYTLRLIISNLPCAVSFDDVDITIIPVAPLTGSGNQTDVLCKGDSTGSVEITPNGGTGPYKISPARTSGLSAGSYIFTITDANNCTATVPVTILEPAAVLSGFSGNQTDVLCKGDSTGSVEITPNGGTGPYKISPARTSGLSAGSYIFTITDANNCTATVPVTILEPAAVLSGFSGNQTDVLCKGDSTGSVEIIPNGGTGPYKISPARTSGLSAGSYIFTITDANNCTATVPVTILEPAVVLSGFSGNQTDVLCKGDSTGSVEITPNGGTGPYKISPARTSGLSAGSYIFTITDANNCTATVPVTILEPAVVLSGFSGNQTDVLCKGDSTGSVEITPNGGTGPYKISPARTSGLSAGSYIFTITDANNCTATVPVTILEPAAVLSGFSGNQTDVLCKGDSTGSVEITPNGGTGPYKISPARTSGLSAGSYIFTITDANNCTATVPVTILEPAAVLSGFSGNQTDVLCKSDSTGSVEIIPNGGTGPYKISPARTSGLSAGSYIFTITDANNCTATVPVTILEPAAVLSGFSGNQTDVLCKGDSTGSVEIIPNGGTGPYKISPARTSGLSAGSYIFTITDANNCTATVPVTILEPAAVLSGFSGNQTDVLCKGDSTGSVEITPNGGTGPYKISPARTSGLSAGSYIFTITDANNCTATVPVTILEPLTVLKMVINHVDILCKGDNSGVIVAIATGNTGNYRYSLLNDLGTLLFESKTDGNFTGLRAGNYRINVESGICKISSEIITVKEPLSTLNATFKVIDVTCNGKNNGKIEIIAEGGIGIVEYSISTKEKKFQVSNVFDDLAAGMYDVIVKDENGCAFLIKGIEINEPEILTAEIFDPIVPELCPRDNNGSFRIKISGGTGPYNCIVDNRENNFLHGTLGQAIFDFANLSGGKHIVGIKDALECTFELEIVIPDAVLINPVVNVDYLCSNTSENLITVAIDFYTVDNDDFDYAIDGDIYQSSNIFHNIISGLHLINVRHTNGCIKSVPFQVAEVKPLALVLANGELNEILISGSGGQEEYQYRLNGELLDRGIHNFIIYKSGNYIVSVTDRNGCTATASRYFEYIDVCIPNHFTPNGDGINDEWSPGCTLYYKNLEYSIFDRYGRQIIDRNHLGQKWDGKYKGIELPSGDYWYILKLNDDRDDRNFVGHFTLYR